MVFTTEGLFEVAIESWPEWDLNPRYIYLYTYNSHFEGLQQNKKSDRYNQP